MEIIEITPNDITTCDWFLLADNLLREFSDLVLKLNPDTSFSTDAKSLKGEGEEENGSPEKKAPLLSMKKQLVLVRSCLSDVIYAIQCLGFWCAKKTIQMYICEFSRLSQSETHEAGLIEALMTILNSFYTRLEKLMIFFPSLGRGCSNDDTVLSSSSKQLKLLLDYIKNAKPTAANANWPICVIYVRRRVIAKVIALWLEKISAGHEDYSFIKPNYIVGSSRKHRNRMTVDNFDLHHEASVRDFRYGNCNVLVTSSITERCMIMPRCTVVISFDVPTRFSDYIQAKSNCRFDSSKYIIIVNRLLEQDPDTKLLKFMNMEKILNNLNRNIALEAKETQLMELLDSSYPPYPSASVKNPATIMKSLGIINKYCTKLPSDSFTKLSPEWTFKTIENKDRLDYYCEVRLPINSPVRQTIVGPLAPTKNIAMRLAAFTAVKLLHKSNELDDNMIPVTKESMKPSNFAGAQKEPIRPKSRGSSNSSQPIGSTKHRQYYKKRIAKVFSGPLVYPGTNCYLYEFSMVLTCPLPEEQNRRGRRIIDPSETNRNYAIVCCHELPKICSFPVFTRSGEVLISIKLVKKDFVLDDQQVENLLTFHEYTFSKVLRLEKYPTLFDPDNSPFKVLLVPVLDGSETGISETIIDWEFVDKIISSKDSQVPSLDERKNFQFNQRDYVDAVVIPWYRLTDRQQFAYYVAEICSDLNPESPFPDEDSGFKTFTEYYKSKYDLDIFHKDQPVLDVDHTSARLNLLTPRYVNRKGKTLPSSNAKTRKESRENLIQKQLLIPELCSIHPFPASFWRKAVCLPCIFYRLNSLFLAEELRRKVAEATRIGFIEPPADFQWSILDFGWSLKDVINTSIDNEDDDFIGNFYSEDYSPTYYGDWKDTKSKNGPLIRELFLPYTKYKKDQPEDLDCAQSVVKSRQLSSNFKTMSLGEELVSSESKDSINYTQSLESNDRSLLEILEIVYQKKLEDFSEERIMKSIHEWYDVLNRMTNSVERILMDEPNLFEDNGIELITVDDLFEDVHLELQPTFGELLPNRDADCNWSNEDWKKIKFDPIMREIQSNGPGLSIILQALTMANASDGINLERLETVGDSFLKYSITAYLYCMYPSMHEGKLSYLRSTEISNANLYSLGKSKCLGEIMSATKFEPNDNWLAPGYSVAESTPQDDSGDSEKKREIDKALAEVPYDLLLQHSIPDKSIADCVEALIGAYLTASGSRAALLFMQWLGLQVIPPSFDLTKDIESYDIEKNDSIWHWLEQPPSPLISLRPFYDDNAKNLDLNLSDEQLRELAQAELHHHYTSKNLAQFEKDIGYSFRDKAYLVQAFTHNSFFENHVTDCHQRLEFLGDALLDYLITRYLFEDPRCHSPGTLTDLRSALVNNTFFASLAVKYNFHRYLLYISDELFNVIDGFVKKFKFDNKDLITKGTTLLITEGESEYAEDIEVPKALGDVFESVAGAIYFDSGMSLDQVWDIYFRMMKPEIEYFSSNVPKSPIRELLESMPQNVRFSPSELAPDRKHRVIAEVFGLGRFIGVGRNKHSAKSTAAKRALRMLALKRKGLEKKQAVKKGRGSEEKMGVRFDD